MFRSMATKVWRFTVKHKYPIALVVINLIVFHEWFFRFSYLTWGDWQQPYTIVSKELFTLPYIWSNFRGSLGGLNAFPSFYPLYFLQGLLANMGIGYAVIERLLYMWPLVIVSSLGSYYLFKEVTKSELAAFVGSIAYNFNTYVLITRCHHLYILGAYSFAPLVLLYFIRTLKEKRYYLAAMTGLFCCIAGFYELRVFGIIAFVMVLYAVYHTLFIEKPTIRLALRNALLTSIPLALVILTNLYWLFGYLKSGGLSASPVFTSSIRTVTPLSFTHALALHHPFWTGAEIGGGPPHVPWFFYIVPVLVLLGLVLGWRNRNAWFFGLIALIGVMLTKFLSGPFPGLYTWLFKHLPGFKMFSEPSKFYLLVCLGYSALIAILVERLGAVFNRANWAKVVKYSVAALILVLFLFNAVPVFNGSIDALFTPGKVLGDVRLFNEFITEQENYFRVLWVPEASRWATETTRHPIINFSYAVTGSGFGGLTIKSGWSEFIHAEAVIPSVAWRDLMKTLAYKEYFSELLSNASIKYVVVPINDIESGDNFDVVYGVGMDIFVQALDKVECLKRIDIGTKELAVYEFKDFRPYVDSEETVFRLDTLSELDYKYGFTKDVLGKRFSFVAAEGAPGGSLTDLHNLFEPSERARVTVSGDAVRQEVGVGPGAGQNTAFENRDRQTIFYEVTGGRLVISASSIDNLFLNGATLHFPTGTPGKQIASAPLDPGRDYYLSVGGSIVPVVPGPPRAAGVLAPGQELSILSSARGSLVSNGSFEKGLWHKDVQDFNNYDKRPVLAMRITEGEEGEGSKAVELEAGRHIAATVQTGIPVNPGASYLLSIDYESPTVGSGGYVVALNPGGTEIKQTLPVEDEKWHTYQTIFKAPEGTSAVNLALLCGPKDDGKKGVMRYDNVGLYEASPVASHRVEGDGFEQASAPVRSGENAFEFREPGYTFSSIVSNGSFEKGLWHKDVQDFNNYDKRPVLAMRITEGEEGEGSKAVELEAGRHIAATVQTGLPVNPGASYLFSIDYESPTVGSGGYVVSFDQGGTQIKQTLPVEDEKWHTYQTIFKAPEGTSAVNLALLCSPKDDGKKGVMRYDNVGLYEVPDFINWYYLVSEPGETLKSPGSIEFKDMSPTKKTVHVSSARTPFFLSMSESYHPGWKMTVSSKGKGSLAIPESQHYKLDDVSNAWFVDLTELKGKGLARRNPDGTYDLDATIEFSPQGYCYAGFVISLIVFLALVAYLLVDWRRRRRRAEHEG